MYLRIKESKILIHDVDCGNYDRMLNLDLIEHIYKDVGELNGNNIYSIRLESSNNNRFGINFGTDKEAREHEFEEIMRAIVNGYPLHVVGAN